MGELVQFVPAKPLPTLVWVQPVQRRKVCLWRVSYSLCGLIKQEIAQKMFDVVINLSATLQFKHCVGAVEAFLQGLWEVPHNYCRRMDLFIVLAMFS